MRAGAVPGAGVWHREPQPAAHAPRGLDGCHWLHTRPGTTSGACPAARPGTRRALQGRRSCATTGVAAGWMRGGCGVAVGHLWAVLGVHLLGQGDEGLASAAPGGGMVGLYLCLGGCRPARSRRSSTCGFQGSPGRRRSGWGRQRCSSGRASVGRCRVWLEGMGSSGLGVELA